jgi:hypothetical protein
MKRVEIGTALLLLICLNRPLQGQVTLRGFVQNQDMFRARETTDAMLVRNRLRLNTELSGDNVAASASLDITNDITDSTTTLPNLREVYLDIYGNWLDLRIGKQQVVWGKTDGYFINDIVNPLDLSYFLLQEFDDIRMATTMLNAKLHRGNHSLEMLLIPEFKPINLLFEGDWGYTRPEVMTIPITQTQYLDVPLYYGADSAPKPSLKNAEYGFKFNTFLLGTDLALIYLRSREDRPVYFTQLTTNSSSVPIRVDLTPTHPWQSFFGLNFSRPWGAFVFRGEGGYYPERHFNTENQTYLTDGMIIAKPFTQFMLGADYQLSSAFDISVQGINERILDFEEGIQNDENVMIGTLMLRGHFFNETVSPLFFLMNNFEDNSFLLRLSVDWNYADNFTITGGADFLSGDTETIFGMYSNNDNVYLKLKYNF